MTHSGNTTLGDCIGWYFKHIYVSYTPPNTNCVNEYCYIYATYMPLSTSYSLFIFIIQSILLYKSLQISQFTTTICSCTFCTSIHQMENISNPEAVVHEFSNNFTCNPEICYVLFCAG